MGVDGLAETASGAERQAKELELVSRSAGAVGEQLQALIAHIRVLFVGQQLDAIVERPDGRHQIVAEPRTKQTGEIDRIHRLRVMRQSLIWRKKRPLNRGPPNPYSA